MKVLFDEMKGVFIALFPNERELTLSVLEFIKKRVNKPEVIEDVINDVKKTPKSYQ